MILLPSITVSGDMRFSKLIVFTRYKLKDTVEAEVEVEVNIFHKINVKR